MSDIPTDVSPKTDDKHLLLVVFDHDGSAEFTVTVDGLSASQVALAAWRITRLADDLLAQEQYRNTLADKAKGNSGLVTARAIPKRGGN